MNTKDFIELMNQLGKVSVEATMTCAEFLEALKSLSEAFHITEDEVFANDEKIVIIPKGDIEKPIKLVFESEENEAFQKCVNAIADAGEGYPMTSEEIKYALDKADDCYVEALQTIFDKKGEYQIEFD